MKSELLSNALNYINPSNLSYLDWLRVGMALKTEGYSIDDFIKWSYKDPAKAKLTDFERKWNSFNESGVTGATIMELAKQEGFIPKRYEGDGCMDFNDTIEFDGTQEILSKPAEPSGGEQLIKYLKTLFNDSDYVGFVTSNAFFDTAKGKWLPGNCGT